MKSKDVISISFESNLDTGEKARVLCPINISIMSHQISVLSVH